MCEHPSVNVPAQPHCSHDVYVHQLCASEEDPDDESADGPPLPEYVPQLSGLEHELPDEVKVQVRLHLFRGRYQARRSCVHMSVCICICVTVASVSLMVACWDVSVCLAHACVAPARVVPPGSAAHHTR